jgi:hypothetical protein
MGLQLLRGGVVDQWLRRSLGDSALASRLDEAQRQRQTDAESDDTRADSLLLTRAVALLDPLAPLCWRGLSLWPDGLGPAIAATGESAQPHLAALEQLIAAEATAAWAACRPERCDPMSLRTDAHQQRSLLRLRGWGGGMARLRYALNPLLPCASAAVAGAMVVRLTDVLPALEATAAGPNRPLAGPIDRELAAFMAARHEQRIEGDLASLANPRDAGHGLLVQLRLLGWLQQRLRLPGVPALAAWLAEQAAPLVEKWRNRPRREQVAAAVSAVAKAGHLAAMLALLDDANAKAADEQGAREAEQMVRRIDAELAQLEADGPARAEEARRIGQELAVAAALVAMAITVMAAALA